MAEQREQHQQIEDHEHDREGGRERGELEEQRDRDDVDREDPGATHADQEPDHHGQDVEREDHEAEHPGVAATDLVADRPQDRREATDDQDGCRGLERERSGRSFGTGTID